ncbi:uncharacterized protein LOC126967950 [Leptidea sinapis]|uniref:uncharacterized protein LOC126967950 n=1 Tax=Leptidea sinapis TaxID=189913 RepID=UPI0021C48BFB|nr:uncharacterized protein LOC126967950 [Leptidea sinapis]
MTWSMRSGITKCKVDDELLAGVNVKPLVAIHERWIQEANMKTERSKSLPESKSRKVGIAVKPASHCVDFQRSLPQLYFQAGAADPYRGPSVSPASGSTKNGSPWDEIFSKTLTLHDLERGSQRGETDKSTITDDMIHKQTVNQATDTRSIEEFIRHLIQKELQSIAQDFSETASEASRRTDELTHKVVNVLESNGEKTPVKCFSKVKINGNNKPLVQITFSRSGENTLQVLDNCVNVTVCDSGKDKISVSLDDTVSEEGHVHALKRCQAFNAIQEARSTEDIYIDDELSTQIQENFGGRVKILPLHGSLHEILCEKEDDCCLIKVKRENGCDSLYFRCDSDTESRDATDGHNHPCSHKHKHTDTVVYKRISLVEEIQRVCPKRNNPVTALRMLSDRLKSRPKSEVFLKNITQETRAMSNSSPSLLTNDREVEVNIENVMSYQDSSSDENIKCDDDDFEIIEREIEEGLAAAKYCVTGGLEKISEENLSVLNDEIDSIIF